MNKVTTISITMTTIDYIQSDMDYLTRVDSSVNPKPAELIIPYTDGAQRSPMTFVNYSKINMGGGLASKDFKPPDFQPTTDGTPMYFGMDWQLIFRADMWPTIARLELDDKVMLAKAAGITPVPKEQMNESHQFNQDTQQWQYDPDGKGWVDIGFKPKIQMLLADSTKTPVNDVRFRWWWNGKHGDAGRWSSLQMAQNTEYFSLPDKFKNLPLIAEPWGGPLRHPQIQTEYSGVVPGWHAFSIQRGRLVHSTSPIPIDLPWS